ncbi:MAG: LppX_LprAFG lipoprotein [Thermomicrobiales bacterium]|nr:LppX_LprAFG lipoprotein [Thermomicrobiales bacterium]
MLNRSALTRRRLFACAAVTPLVLRVAIPVAAEASAAERLREAATAMGELRSFHFALTTPRGSTTVLNALELKRLEGDVLRPDRYRATIEAGAAIVTVSIDVIGIGSRLWMSDPTSAEQRFIEVSLSDDVRVDPWFRRLVNPDAFWLALPALVSDPVAIGENRIDGAPVSRIDGTIDLARIFAAVGGEVPGFANAEPLPVSVWLTPENRLRRLELEGAVVAGEDSTIIRRLDITAYDEPVTIEPPPAA